MNITNCTCHCHSEASLPVGIKCRCIKNCEHCHPENFKPSPPPFDEERKWQKELESIRCDGIKGDYVYLRDVVPIIEKAIGESYEAGKREGESYIKEKLQEMVEMVGRVKTAPEERMADEALVVIGSLSVGLRYLINKS